MAGRVDAGGRRVDGALHGSDGLAGTVWRARRVIRHEIAELNRLVERVGDSFSAAIETLRRAVENRAKIVIVGVGKSGNIGQKLAATLNST
ncbi:MAG: hypothetical protein OT643_15455, partial [Bacteroidetes bacterium]|nr:hypothetical protein [Bacteroidota bacterium]